MDNLKFQLDEKRTERLMNAIVCGKYININHFLRLVGVERASFNHFVKKIEVSNPELYSLYKEGLNKNLEQFIVIRGELISLIDDMINNGVVFENGMVGNFEEVDWFINYSKYFEGVNRSILSKIIEERDKKFVGNGSRAICARKLISKATNPLMGNYYNALTKCHILMDKNYGLTDEEKYVIINLFDKHNIPYNCSTFDCAARRLVDYRNYCFTNSYEVDYSTCFNIVGTNTKKRVR